jgi:hypothetical protein
LPRRAWLSAACAAALAASTPPARGGPPPALRDGDVVLQTSRSSRSWLIRKASESPYSHIGLVEVAPDGVFILEAISPVSRTPWGQWRRRGEGGKVTALRPRGLDAAALGRVVAEAKAALGRPYDARYRWDDESLYCSELVVKAFERGARVGVGERQRVASLRLTPAELERARGLGVDPAQELVTPASIARDARFDELFSDFAQAPPPRAPAARAERGAWAALKRWLAR